MAYVKPKCEKLIACLLKVAPKNIGSKGDDWPACVRCLNKVYMPRGQRRPADARGIAEHLGRGFDLMYQAADQLEVGHPTLEDHEPVVRGVQWRIVMWRAGYEQVRAGLQLAHTKADKGAGMTETKGAASARFDSDIASLLHAVATAPATLTPGDADDELKSLERFLNLQKRQGLAAWVRGTMVPVGWRGIIEMAEEVRHATVHGAFSARKACAWRLERGLGELLNALNVITLALDEALAAQPDK